MEVSSLFVYKGIHDDISISQLGIDIACNVLITQKKFNAKITSLVQWRHC